MFNWLWATADCHEWPANMYSMSCNLPVRSRWSFIPAVLPLAVEPARFWAELYHPTLSKSRCVLVKKAHSLVLICRPKFLLSKDGTDESSRPAHGSLTTNCQYARRPVLAAGNGQGRFVHRKIDGLSSRAIRA